MPINFLGLPVKRGDKRAKVDAGCSGSRDWGGVHMGVKYSAAGQSGCNRGDGSRSLGGRRVWCRGVDRDSSKEKTRERTAESIWVCFTSHFGECW